jgi:hypothetical protein
VNTDPGIVSELLDVAFEHRIALIASALGTPPPYLVERGKEAGVTVAALVGKRIHAERQLAAGVDLLIAQGTEAGGHTGTIATMILTPEIVDVAGDVPVLAAGGIASGRQMAAALALGAAGVWCGSVWLSSEEDIAPASIKQKFLAATSSDTLRSALAPASRAPAPQRVARRVGAAGRSEPVADAAAGATREAGMGPYRRGGRSGERARDRAAELLHRPGGRLVRAAASDRRDHARARRDVPGSTRRARAARGRLMAFLDPYRVVDFTTSAACSPDGCWPTSARTSSRSSRLDGSSARRVGPFSHDGESLYWDAYAANNAA